MTSNEKLCWLLVLILSWTGQSLQQSCRETEDCSCISKTTDHYEVRCPKNVDSTFIIEWVPSKAGITCNREPPWSDFKLQPETTVREVDTFFIEKCSLPDVPLHEISQRIGVQPTEKLMFDSYLNLSSTLERRYLSGFPKLKELSLNSNGLTELPVDLLADLPELLVLQLRENNVILPVGFFNSVPKLRTLELGRNKIEEIDPLLFRNLTQLKVLLLWGNELTQFEPQTFDGLTSLVILSIGSNRLKTLPPEIFKSLGNLSQVDISSNNFSSLPEDLLSTQVNLTSFGMTNNRGKLTTLPNKFLSNLPKLEIVNLARNNLTVLPEDIFLGSSSLTKLYLEENSLSTLPSNIFKDTTKLKLLNLSSNKLTTLPDKIFQALKKLEDLNLRKNNFIYLSKDIFVGLSGLTNLNLEYNGLRNTDRYTFYPLTSLKIARLSHNQLTFEEESEAFNIFDYNPNSPFSHCQKLEELYLSNNNITRIFSDWNLVLLKLHKLDLQYNQISNVETSDFQFLSGSMMLDIKHNNISQVDLKDAEIIASTQNYNEARNVQISMGKNPLICDCRVYMFLKYLEGRMHPNVQKMFHIRDEDLECNSPKDMTGVSISNLKSKSLLCSMNSNCPEKCECWYRPEDSTLIANCSYRNFSIAPEKIAVNKNLKIELDLTGNLLTEMPFINQSGYGNITVLLLSYNKISNISANSIPLTLQVLELHHNNLKRLDTKVFERIKNATRLRKLTLHANPWRCDCEARDFLSFIQTKYKEISEILNITCKNDNKSLSKMTADELCPVAVGTVVGASLAVAFLGLFVGILAALYYRYQTEVKVWLYAHQLCLWLVTEEELDKDKLYDAFISYSHKDEDFVVDELLPKLEQGPRPFKLCLHFRDWMAGEWIPTQIARSVEDSRRTIVILSPNFLESVWGRMEFRAAHSQALSEGRARVIVVLYGDVGPTDQLDPELKAYLSMNTYVQWGDPWFWDKLRYALPHPPQVKKNTAKKIFESHQHHIQINGDKNGLIHPPGVPITPPAITTPPANSLKTFTSNGSLKNGTLISNCLINEKNNLNNTENSKLDTTPKKEIVDNNLINGQCTPV